MLDQIGSLIELRVDGEVFEARIESHRFLLNVLRKECGRTSVKEGCESAGCGACTVLLDGEARLSCITLALDAVGSDISTAEGTGVQNGILLRLQDAFIKHHAIQCGFCTPGILNVAVALLSAKPNPTEREVRAAISGNLCRCTGYIRIVRAILEAAGAIETVVQPTTEVRAQ